ncbi:DUF3570 domain-containing protein [Corallincola holothuriorum]|uniref:DUF3570 domain-containing protein n=1 Tax=Corallincola holothuriorum TaxID=2282215 RepID=A0A368NK69_9GAMM|nr:DUF3570 domain-containing protein [Corallincola holothuriorum]RCU50044.1 DUF3570 domain-containing protein [Corallincola holothuriorum]
MAVVEVVVVVTNLRTLLALCLWLPLFVQAAVLPEDRADVLYHRYEGGGMTIDGPAVLVRKSVSEKVSLSGYYYADAVSAASIDVVTTASPYTEDRDEYSFGVDYLHGKSTMSLAYSNSDESDYTANTLSFGISQDMFGDLTTVSLGYAYGWDDVGKNGEADFDEEIDRRSYSLGLTQVLTAEWVMAFNFQAITDEGFLNNPYRSVRYVDPTVAQGYSYQAEVYPHTRTSVAAGISTKYYLPYRAALGFEARYFDDDWEIQAYNVGADYTHPIGDNWVVTTRVRYYSQSEAEFYSDLFPYKDAQNYMARDKELSDFTSITVGAGVTYRLPLSGYTDSFTGSATLEWDHIEFDYNNFRDARETGVGAGEEGLYSFGADVVRAFISVYY